MQTDQSVMQTVSAPVELIAVRAELTFGDGFRFGCGMMAAFVIFWLIIVIVGLLIAGIALVVAPQLLGSFVR